MICGDSYTPALPGPGILSPFRAYYCAFRCLRFTPSSLCFHSQTSLSLSLISFTVGNTIFRPFRAVIYGDSYTPALPGPGILSPFRAYYCTFRCLRFTPSSLCFHSQTSLSLSLYPLNRYYRPGIWRARDPNLMHEPHDTNSPYRYSTKKATFLWLHPCGADGTRTRDPRRDRPVF